MAPILPVHFDNGTVFCEAANQSGLLTRSERDVTCPACIERLRGINDFCKPRDVSISLRRASRLINWFGED